MYFFLFNRTTFQIFVTYLTGALYVHPLWFYIHQHDNRGRYTQNAFSLPFAAILVNCAPSGEMHNYCAPHIIKENYENFLIHACNYILLSHVYCVWQVVKTPTIILNNPVLYSRTRHRWQYNVCALYAGYLRPQTNTIYNTHCFSTSTMVTRTRLCVTLYVHCLSCFMTVMNFRSSWSTRGFLSSRQIARFLRQSLCLVTTNESFPSDTSSDEPEVSHWDRS